MKRLLALIVLLLASPRLAAVDLQKLTFDELAKRSDLVFIGSASSFEVEGTLSFAIVDVKTLLKGSGEIRSVRVAIRTGFAEADPDCCRKRRSYAFFLERNQDGSYSSANGRFGILAIN